MRHVELLEQIRHLVSTTYSELASQPPTDLQETILIRHGHYCGRRFRGDHFHAVWFIEENEVKFYGAGGDVVRVVRVVATRDGSTLEHQRAA